jgi:hypothetical protein
MPINLPNLDDRRYADLIQEARSTIPSHAPEWTNYNASDPGITIVELFAYLFEMLIYRQNRVTDANVRAFLKLIDGVERRASDDLSNEVRKVVAELRKPNRAVTSADFEELVLAKFESRIGRARAVARRNLESDDPKARESNKPGHMSVIIVPTADGGQIPDAAMTQAVGDYLESRRLLTTRVHVVGPRYVKVGVRLTVYLKPDAIEETVRKSVVGELVRFFDPIRGGQDQSGWPFGRNVWVSEVYELLDLLPGVDFVTQTLDHNEPVDELVAEPKRLIKRRVVNADTESKDAKEVLVGVVLFADELVSAGTADMDITILSSLTNTTS